MALEHPTLDLTAGLTGDSLFGPHGQWSYGLSASVPIGSRSLVEGFRQSQWALLIARQRQEDVREQAVADVRSQARSAEAARRSVEIETQGVDVAERSRLFAQEMVDNDLATNKDVLDAQDELRRSQIALVTSKIGYVPGNGASAAFHGTGRLGEPSGQAGDGDDADGGADRDPGRAGPDPGAGGRARDSGGGEVGACE